MVKKKLTFGENTMTSSNENIFCVTGPLCGEFIGHRWIHLTKASDAELWFFFICAWINGWVNHRDACDLRRHRARYVVTVLGMKLTSVKRMNQHQTFSLKKISSAKCRPFILSRPQRVLKLANGNSFMYTVGKKFVTPLFFHFLHIMPALSVC